MSFEIRTNLEVCRQKGVVHYNMDALLLVDQVTDSLNVDDLQGRVGDVLYNLVKSDKDEETAKFGCKDGCVYTADEDPVDEFCFARGDLKATCIEKFHWCYEGDCGPDKWGTAFPV